MKFFTWTERNYSERARAVKEESVRIRAGDAYVAAGIHGRGSPVLLIHGLTASRATWRRVIPLLAPSHAVVAPDLPGRGDSPAPSGLRYRLRDEVHRIRIFLRRLGMERITVAGHSQGAALGLALAATGDEVDGVVLVNPVTPWTSRPGLLSLLDLLPGMEPVAERVVPPVAAAATREILRRRVFTGRAAPSAADIRAFSRPYRRRPTARALPTVISDWNPAALQGYLPRAPAHGSVLAGSCDRRIRPAHAARLAHRLGLEGELVSEAGHALPLERPGVVARTVSRVAAGAGSARSPRDTGADGETDADQRTGGGPRE